MEAAKSTVRAPKSVSAAKEALTSYGFAIGGAVLISVVMNVLILTGPFYMLQIYDRVLPGHSIPTLIAFSALALILFVAHGILDLIRSRLMTRLGSVLDFRLADAAFNQHTNALSQSATGEALHDLWVVRQFLGGPAAVGLLDVPWLPFYMALIFLLHPVIGWVSIGSAILFLIIAGLNEWASRGPATAAEALKRQEDIFVADARANIDTIRAMGMIANIRHQWHGTHVSTIDAAQRGSDLNASFAALSRNLRSVVQSSILGIGAYLTMQNELSSGALIACSIIFARALAPVDQAVAHWRTILAARQSWKRLHTIVKQPDSSQDRLALRPPNKSLTASSVVIASSDRKKVILPNVSFRLEAGDCMVIIGASGVGKSSLVRALVASSPILSGEIRIDGSTLEQWADQARVKHIGYLAQDVQLLDGTIRQNIARFQNDASSEDVIAAAEMAGVHDLIVSFPDGYNTVVGRKGITLSAGQKQRIGLARAIFGNPFVVVLDEPNAHLDREGELALCAAIRRLRESGSILVVAAHRTSILSEVNRMLLLEAGRAGLFGTKEELLAHLAGPRKQQERGLHVVNA